MEALREAAMARTGLPPDEPAAAAPIASPGLNCRRLSEVTPQQVRWAWPGRVPLAKLTLLCGDPCTGKTWVLLDLIARLTAGLPFPDGTGPPCGPCDCLFATAEDGLADTIRPRIDLLGGDPSRVHVVEFVRETRMESEGKTIKKVEREAQLALDRHAGQLDGYLAAHPAIRLVGLDPLLAFMGKADTHRNSDVRAVLGPLAKVAEARGPAVVGVNHLTKGEGTALYRGMGSIGFNAAARAVWQVCADRDDPDRSLLLPVKVNLGPRPTGLAFRLSPAGLCWEDGPVTTTADEALNGPGPGKVAEAKEFLRELLKDGPVAASVAYDKAKAAGVAKSALKAAKRALGAESEHLGGKDGSWQWSLPAEGGKVPIPGTP
jgi:hypothetical protein